MSDVKVTIPRDDYNPNQRTDIDVEVVNSDGTVSTKTVKGAVQVTTEEDGRVTFGILASAHVPFTAGGFSPSDVAGLVGWWDASAITGLSNGDPVSTWEDLSSTGYDLSAASTARPTYQTSQVNGLPAVDFDGGDAMTGASNGLLNSAGNFAVFVVAKLDNASPGPALQNTFFSRDRSVWEFRVYQGSVDFFIGGTSNSSSKTGATTAAHLYAARRTSTNQLTSALDGVEGSAATNSTSPTSINVLTMGLRQGAGNTYLNGKICEALIYDADVSASDVSSIETYLADKWGITI